MADVVTHFMSALYQFNWMFLSCVEMKDMCLNYHLPLVVKALATLYCYFTLSKQMLDWMHRQIKLEFSELCLSVVDKTSFLQPRRALMRKYVECNAV